MQRKDNRQPEPNLCLYNGHFETTNNKKLRLNINIDITKSWSGQRDSNPRPSAPKADALPGCAMPRFDL